MAELHGTTSLLSAAQWNLMTSAWHASRLKGPALLLACVDDHPDTQAIEQDLALVPTPVQTPNCHCARHAMLSQPDGPLLSQQALLHMQAVANLRCRRAQLSN